MPKLHVKIGEHEFCAESDNQSDIDRQFRQFKELVAIADEHDVVLVPEIDPDMLSRAFALHEDEGVSLRFKTKPTREAKGYHAMLLLLGFLLVKRRQRVSTTELKEALERSGFAPVDRMERLLKKELDSGDVESFGQKRGRQYQLSEDGIEFMKLELYQGCNEGLFAE